MSLPIPNPFGTASTQKIKSTWTNNLAANTYVAPYGLMFFDTYDGVLRLGDGSTPGGQIVNTGSGGNGVPGGANTEIQFNNGGIFGGNAALTFDVANSVLTLTGTANFVGNVTVANNVSAEQAVSGKQVFATNGLLLNANTVINDYTIPTGFNAVSGGPVLVPAGVVVDSADGRWTIV